MGVRWVIHRQNSASRATLISRPLVGRRVAGPASELRADVRLDAPRQNRRSAPERRAKRLHAEPDRFAAQTGPKPAREFTGVEAKNNVVREQHARQQLRKRRVGPRSPGPRLPLLRPPGVVEQQSVPGVMDAAKPAQVS